MSENGTARVGGSQVVVCGCGTTLRAEGVEELVEVFGAHLREHHPSVAGDVPFELVLEMAGEE
jgi:hypothetical protein